MCPAITSMRRFFTTRGSRTRDSRARTRRNISSSFLQSKRRESGTPWSPRHANASVNPSSAPSVLPWIFLWPMPASVEPDRRNSRDHSNSRLQASTPYQDLDDNVADDPQKPDSIHGGGDAGGAGRIGRGESVRGGDAQNGRPRGERVERGEDTSAVIREDNWRGDNAHARYGAGEIQANRDSRAKYFDVFSGQSRRVELNRDELKRCVAATDTCREVAAIPDDCRWGEIDGYRPAGVTSCGGGELGTAGGGEALHGERRNDKAALRHLQIDGLAERPGGAGGQQNGGAIAAEGEGAIAGRRCGDSDGLIIKLQILAEIAERIAADDWALTVAVTEVALAGLGVVNPCGVVMTKLAVPDASEWNLVDAK